MNCETCGDPVPQERWEAGYHYCRDKRSCRTSEPLVIVQVAQNKTNAVITTATPKTLREMQEGKFRRDPVVVQRQPSQGKKVVYEPPPRTSYLVYLMDKTTRIWRVAKTLYDEGVAADWAERYQHQGRRVKVETREGKRR